MADTFFVFLAPLQGRTRFDLAADTAAVWAVDAARQTARVVSQTATWTDEVRPHNPVVLLFHPGDVTVFESALPDVSAARLRQILPSLLEDSLLDETVTPSGNTATVLLHHAQGKAHIAAIDTRWLEQSWRAVSELRCKSIRALPAQLALQPLADTLHVWVERTSTEWQLCLRESGWGGMGLRLELAAAENLQAVQQVLHDLCVPDQVCTYSLGASCSGKNAEMTNAQASPPAAPWLRVAGAFQHETNLFAALAAQDGRVQRWARWKNPMRWALVLLLVNLFGLNLHSFLLSREEVRLRRDAQEVFHTTFPGEPLLADPVVQMHQKLNRERARAGVSTADDFLVLQNLFSQAWQESRQSEQARPRSLEYRDRALWVTLAPEGIDRNHLATRLTALGMKLETVSEHTLKMSFAGTRP